MKYIQLGKTDLKVSRICFGCWQLSPKFWGKIPLNEWRQALASALDSGVNFIDTADAYGDGYAEECLGKYLRRNKLRDKFILATKFYWNINKSPRHPDTRYDYIIKACEDSLKRLRTDRIDLYQIHSWDPLTRPDEVAAALNLLKKQGKVRWFGVSNLNVEQMRMYERHFEINCLQPPYSMLRREIESRELPYCLENRIGVISYSSLYRGILTGKYKKGHVFNDSRDGNKMFQGKAFEIMLETVDKLKPIARKYKLSLAQFAIRWILTHPALSCAIVGIKNSNNIKSIVKAADGELALEDWHKAANIVAAGKQKAEGAGGQ